MLCLMILANFLSNLSKPNKLGRFDNFDEFSPFALLHAFLDIPRFLHNPILL